MAAATVMVSFREINSILHWGKSASAAQKQCKALPFVGLVPKKVF
ncbi:hypothetical protein [Simplicispira psychrophila]|nr:hypothetical protein [Simplicispira psychrophila]